MNEKSFVPTLDDVDKIKVILVGIWGISIIFIVILSVGFSPVEWEKLVLQLGTILSDVIPGILGKLNDYPQ